ncbi:MAG: tRNA dihydrouridine(20/20a) synthase DusA [Oceanospirillales bacterium LUC14_002_19_P2]|nr:MAG: tRNA dihydrouridine(20/20a) synthase DusA [Oceanospirillales bacterium LUC14_002_19_P2]
MTVKAHNEPSRLFSVAPMMDWTDRHCRYFLRQISQSALLYTEMVTTGALIHGDRNRFLDFNPEEHPVALQLGGNDPKDLAECAHYAGQWGYDEVNLNVGCPSDRVQNGRIGACLMAEPETVAACVKAMRDRVDIPVTVKHRIGINGRDSWDALVDFVGQVAEAGCKTFIVHARIAILEGLSPKENRDIPPLRYDVVYRLKETFPELEIILNGGVKTIAETLSHLQHVDGVMVGREAYQNPWLLADVDNTIYGQENNESDSFLTRHAVMEAMLPYIDQCLANGSHLNHITRHVLGLFNGQPGARRFRRHLSENGHRAGAGIDVIHDALALVPDIMPSAKIQDETPTVCLRN